MQKDYKQDAERKAVFLTPIETNGERDKKGERFSTSPLRSARMIDIERIEPDPDQLRKTFNDETLESLAESIREIGDIIDPLTVEYDESKDRFKIISGERRYRAAKMVGLERLPCIIKESDEKRSFLIQLTANLQRQDISPLEESEGIQTLIEKFGYSQVRAAELLNKSKSYISQILGLVRLAPPAKQIAQKSLLPKEVLIHASRQKEPEKQTEILKKASQEDKTIRQIRAEGKAVNLNESETTQDTPIPGAGSNPTYVQNARFRKWKWAPDGRGFVITIQFDDEQEESKESEVISDALALAQRHIGGLRKKTEE